MKVLCVILLATAALASKKIERRSFSVDLNEFFDANFQFAQEIIPINNIVQGTKLFPVITNDNGTFTDIRLMSMEPIKRIADFVQLVEIDTMRNTIRGTIGSDKITLQIGSIESARYLGPTVLKDMGVVVNKPLLNIETVMAPQTPNTDKVCSFTSNIKLLTNGDVKLRSNYAFYNDTDISAFFRETFQGFVNDKMINNGKNIPIPGHCDPVLYLKQTLASLF